MTVENIRRASPDAAAKMREVMQAVTDGKMGSINGVDLTRIPAISDCEPGMRAVEYNVIVAVADVAERKGSIILADTTKEIELMAQQLGRLVKIAPAAFSYARDDAWGEDKPKPGDIVWFARFTGREFTGRDGRFYRLMKDQDIGCVIE